MIFTKDGIRYRVILGGFTTIHGDRDVMVESEWLEE
jgi:hypothetical protein